MVILFIIDHFYNLFCKFSDDHFQITNYFKHKEYKKGIKSNKPS